MYKDDFFVAVNKCISLVIWSKRLTVPLDIHNANRFPYRKYRSVKTYTRNSKHF